MLPSVIEAEKRVMAQPPNKVRAWVHVGWLHRPHPSQMDARAVDPSTDQAPSIHPSLAAHLPAQLHVQEYSGYGGSAAFCRLAAELALGPGNAALAEGRTASVQTLSGTGALRVCLGDGSVAVCMRACAAAAAAAEGVSAARLYPCLYHRLLLPVRLGCTGACVNNTAAQPVTRQHVQALTLHHCSDPPSPPFLATAGLRVPVSLLLCLESGAAVLAHLVSGWHCTAGSASCTAHGEDGLQRGRLANGCPCIRADASVRLGDANANGWILRVLIFSPLCRVNHPHIIERCPGLEARPYRCVSGSPLLCAVFVAAVLN